MDPPKSKTTIRISTNLGPASQFTNSPMTTIELKGRTKQEKGEHYLQLSLKALEELATLLEDSRLSEDQRSSYYNIYDTSVAQHDDMIELRNQLLSTKKSFLNFIVNIFVRESDVKRFHKITYRNFANIRRTSDDLHRLLLPDRNAILGSLGGSAQGHVPVCEESPRDVVEGSLPVTDLPANETIRGINVEVHDEQEEQMVFGALNRIAKSQQVDEDQDDGDDDRTIRPTPSQSRPPSPSPICTLIWNNYNINRSVVSFDSETTGTTLNVGVDEGRLPLLDV